MTTQSYLVVYEKGEHNWSGYSPQVPGCISAGETLDEMRAMMTEALEFHLANLLMDGDPIPEPVGGIVDFSDETPANGVEHCHVEWLPVRISCEFAGNRVDSSMELMADEQEQDSGAEIHAGALRSVFTQTGIKHP